MTLSFLAKRVIKCLNHPRVGVKYCLRECRELTPKQNHILRVRTEKEQERPDLSCAHCDNTYYAKVGVLDANLLDTSIS